MMARGGLGPLATWHLAGGPVGPPARWAATSNVEGGSGTEKEDQGRNSSTRINYFKGPRVTSYATAHFIIINFIMLIKVDNGCNRLAGC